MTPELVVREADAKNAEDAPVSFWASIITPDAPPTNPATTTDYVARTFAPTTSY